MRMPVWTDGGAVVVRPAGGSTARGGRGARAEQAVTWL